MRKMNRAKTSRVMNMTNAMGRGMRKAARRLRRKMF